MIEDFEHFLLKNLNFKHSVGTHCEYNLKKYGVKQLNHYFYLI